MRVQTADKNITIIHMSIIHNITSPPVVLSHQNPQRYGICLKLRPIFACKHCLICAYFSPDSGKTNLDKVILWIKDLSQMRGFSLHTMLMAGLESCGILVDYCDVFISLDSHSDGTHSLQRIYWSANDVMLIFSKTLSMKKQTHLILDGLRVSKLLSNSNFRVYYFFKSFLENFKKRPHCIPKIMFQPSKSLSLSTTAWEGRAAVLHRLWNHRQEIYHDYSSLHKKWILFIF